MPFRFGTFTLDETRRQLFRGQEPLHISPKALHLLEILIGARPRALSKAELQEALWPGTFVTEGNLASLVAELRSALDDDARNPTYIRTVHGFGYSFAAEASEEGAVDAHAADRNVETLAMPRKRAAAVLIVVGLILLVGMATIAVRRSGSRSESSGSPIRSIAVLPFDTQGVSESDAHLGLGLADLTITRLSNVKELSVRPTSAIASYVDRTVDAREVGRALGVDGVLEGRIRTTPERVRVTVQLIEVSSGTPVWADQFDEPRAELFTIEDRISTRVASALISGVTPGERALLSKRHTSSPDAYQLYIEGRYHLQKWSAGSPATMQTASEKFRQALEKDPGYALAWADLAKTYAYPFAGPPSGVQEAEGAALRALELDPTLHEAYVPLGMVKMFWELDYAGAERDFQRALAANPRDWDAVGWYAYLLQSLGRFDEALRMRQRQVELAPSHPVAHWGVANVYLTSRRYDLARPRLEQVLAMKPDYHEATVGMIRVLVAEERHEEAIELARKLVEAEGQTRALSFLGYALAKAGRTADAREVLDGLYERAAAGYVPPFSMANIHVPLGEHDAAMELLEKAFEERDYVIRLKTEPTLDPLRSDPRFQNLLARAGF